MDIAIVGAGMAGLTCASRLRDAGCRVSVFDKGRGPGGRMSTRRMESRGQTLRFDHGAQYFTVRDPEFVRQIEEWERRGIVACWQPGGDDAWVGTPGMNAPIRAMADELDVQFNRRVDEIEQLESGWRLLGEGLPEKPFEAVIVAVPAEQAGPLLQAHAVETAHLANSTHSQPCWTVMAAFERPLQRQADALRNAGPIGWAARNSSKPQRDETECWVIQASPEWSRAHLEDDGGVVEELLLQAFAEEAGEILPPVMVSGAHRWRFAKSGSAGVGHAWSPETRLGVCGDWLLAPRVEAAFLSGLALAKAVLAQRT